jgi:tetratricopeptide (TPR) repeat protein
MKALILYVEKWYIIGTVCSDDNTIVPINLENHEDRVWLYFFINQSRDEVSFSINYKDKAFEDRGNTYITDIFSKLPESACRTYRLGSHEIEMKNIFRDAGVFAAYKKMFETESPIDTYISFSEDIGIISRRIFSDAMKDEGFNIKSSVVPIERLVLDYFYSTNQLHQDTDVLILKALNENLHYSVYHQQDGNCVLREDHTLKGLGVDFRYRAVIEWVINRINDVNHILCNDNEKDEERLYFGRYVEEWVKKIDDNSPFQPIDLGLISFSKQPNNKEHVCVEKSKIEKETERTIGDVMNKVCSIIPECNLTNGEIGKVIFIGSTFRNSQFLGALQARLGIEEGSVLNIDNDSLLPQIISSYINLSILEDEQKKFNKASDLAMEKASAEMKRAEEERKAQEEEAQKVENQTALNAANRKYKENIRNAEDMVAKGDWQSALDYYTNANGIKANEPEILQKMEAMRQNIAADNQRAENYNKAIIAAKQAATEKDWDGVLRYAQIAIDNNPDSIVAKKYIGDAKREKKNVERIKSFMTRADVFFAQKDYGHALEELKKAKGIDENFEGLKDKIKETEDAAESQKKELGLLIAQLDKAESDHDYTTAINICNQVIVLTHDSKWNGKVAILESNRDKALLNQKSIEEYYAKLNNAKSEKRWDDVIHFCDFVLALNENEENAKKEKIEASSQKELCQKIESLISDKEKAKFDHNYKEAISICERLMQIDKDNTSTWADEINSINDVLNKEKESLRTIQNSFDTAFEKQEWGNVVQLFNKESILRENKDNVKKVQTAKRLLKFGTSSNVLNSATNSIPSTDQDATCDNINDENQGETKSEENVKKPVHPKLSSNATKKNISRIGESTPHKENKIIAPMKKKEESSKVKKSTSNVEETKPQKTSDVNMKKGNKIDNQVYPTTKSAKPIKQVSIATEKPDSPATTSAKKPYRIPKRLQK